MQILEHVDQVLVATAQLGRALLGLQMPLGQDGAAPRARVAHLFGSEEARAALQLLAHPASAHIDQHQRRRTFKHSKNLNQIKHLTGRTIFPF